MRVPLSWLRDYAEIGTTPVADVAEALTNVGLKVESVDRLGADVDNVVVARVLDIEELSGFKRPVRWCRIDDGSRERQVICGARNFAVGDTVAYARPPAHLPGGVLIEAREAYGRSSDGMICSAAELGLSDDHTGILVLEAGLPLGADVVEALGLRDDVIELAVNPDRGYALSIRGVARDLAAALTIDFRDPADVHVPAADEAGYPVRIEDRQGCDRYVARVVMGIDPQATSPVWLQRRLTLSGMRPVSLTVDVTNYVMLEVGQPLHAFDRDSLAGPIVVRRSHRDERLTTLDDVKRLLHADDLLITDDSGPIGLAGVMGGGSTEVSPTTTAIVLEAAHFDPVSIAYTSRRHRLSSEAARRFERGVDDALPPHAAELAVRQLASLAGARAEAGLTDLDRRSPRPAITMAARLAGEVAGVSYDSATVRSRLAQVGCEVDGTEVLQVTAPSWRPDLRQPIDLVEEVVRLEGYDALPTTVPTAPGGRGLTREQRLRRTVGRSLAGAGYVEVLTYPFVSEETAAALLLTPDDPRTPSVRLANPVSDEEPWLRASLLPGLLTALARNVGRGYSDIALFETGAVFRAGPRRADAPRPPVSHRPTDAELAAIEAALPEQPTQAAAVLCGRWESQGWWGPGRPALWADAIEAARTVAGALNVPLSVEASEHPPWHPGRCAALLVGADVIGHAGELHPRVAEALSLPARTAAMELRLDALIAAAPEVVPAPVVSPFPLAAIDVALVVDAQVPAAAVERALVAGAGDLLESLRLFDVYTGEQVGEGRKSLAYALRLRAPDRTLTVEEAVAVRDAAVAEAGRATGAVLRG